MPVKSRPHRSNLTLAGHLVSPSGTEPCEWSPRPAVRLLAERQSGTEPPVTAGGARDGAGEDSNTDTSASGTKEETLALTHIPTGSSSSSDTPDRDLLFTRAAGGSGACMRMCVC